MPVYPSTAAARTISTVIAELMHNSASFRLVLTTGEEVTGRPLFAPGPEDTAVEIVGTGNTRRFVHLLHVVEVRTV